MKNKNSLTIFDVRNRKKKSLLLWLLVAAIVMTTCFSQAPFVSEADVDIDTGDDTYFECIIKEMQKDRDRKFTILEVVPDESCSEFLYYAADKTICDKLDWINENEQESTIKSWYSTIGGYDGYLKDPGQYQLNANGFSNFKFTFNISRLTGKKYVEVENIFLNYVLPDYADFLEDRMTVNLKEANEVTAEDVENADFIYVSTKCHDNNTYEVNQFFEKYQSDGKGGYLTAAEKKVMKYTNSNGTFTAVEVKDSAGAPTYMDYEFVAYNSEKDILLQSKITGENPEYLTYPAADGTGYYISRDLSWQAAEKVMEVCLEGKTFQNGEIRQVPVVFDASTIGTGGNNVKRMEAVIRSVVTDVPEDEKNIIKDSEGNTYTGYSIVKNMISTQYSVYNEYGAKTAVISSEYYNDHTADTVDASGNAVIVDACDNDRKPQAVTLNGARYITKTDWEGYLAYLCQDIQYGRANNIKLKIDAEGKFTNAVIVGDKANYTNNGVDVFTSAATNFLIDNQAFTSRQLYLNPHYYAFHGTQNLIPANYNDKMYGVTNASDLLGKSEGTYTVIDILKYLLGVANTKINVDPDPEIFGGLYLKVLEIEPSSKFLFDTEEKVKDLAAALGIGESNLVTADSEGVTQNEDGSYTVPKGKFMLDVDSYTPNAVNGLNDSFVETYDIVYIGDYIGNLKTNSSGKTVYRDTSLNGCLYTAYGDTVTVKSELMGFLSEDFAGTYTLGGITYRYLKDGGSTARLSGNDLTDFKTEQLMKFAQAGNIVLVGDNLYDPQYTYKTSNVRKLVGAITERLSLKANVFPYSKAAKTLYAYRDLNPVFQSVTVKNSTAGDVSKALSYSAEEGIVNNVIKTGGTETKLTFQAEMSNLDAEKNYRLKIILDKNGDGIFGETKKEDDTNELYHDQVYAGSALSTISVSVELNKKFSGLFIWKIIVQEENSSKIIKGEQTGSVAINAREREVNVLQIVPGEKVESGKADYKINLLMAGQDAATGNYVTANNIRTTNGGKGIYTTTQGLYGMTEAQVESNSDINAFEKLLWQTYQAIGYKINVTAMTTQQFNESYGNINDYDMVVIGFADCYGYSDVNEAAAEKITEYIESGKALLFSHDTVSFTSLSANEYKKKSGENMVAAGDYWSPNISTRFRNLVGMNRYGVSTDAAENGNSYVPESEEGTKITQIQGIANPTLIRYNRGYQYPYVSGAKLNGNLTTTKVSKLNSGQVTQYPFYIDEQIDVASTHTQYYQLDLEVPKDDEGNQIEEEKVMVWYTLAAAGSGDSYYTDAVSDAINNYYIYSKDNITYTGAGHSKMLNSDGTATSLSELKLFVNTIVKAIAAGNFPPEIEVKNAQMSTGRYNIYLNELSSEDDYKIVFEAQDADLYDKIGKFAAASLVWIDDSGMEHILIDYGNTLVSGVEQTFYLKDTQSGKGGVTQLTAEQYSSLTAEIQGGTADFTIRASDSRGAEASVNVGFALRQLFQLD